jgi:hypothetical protein
VLGIPKEGPLASNTARDVMKGEAIQQMGEEVDCSGIYVTTHCNDGADRYASAFSFTALSRKVENLQVIFQCRVQPGKFTKHTEPVKVGEAWRFVDQNSIRPYGILLKAAD